MNWWRRVVFAGVVSSMISAGVRGEETVLVEVHCFDVRTEALLPGFGRAY